MLPKSCCDASTGRGATIFTPPGAYRPVPRLPRHVQAPAAVPVPQIDRLQFTSGPPGPSRQCSSKSRVIARDSSSTSNVSTISTRLQAQSTDSTAQQQQHDQEIKGLKQLVAQQQTLIQALQADVHELRSMLVQPAASHNSHNSSSSSSEQGPSSWHQRGQQTTVVPIIAPPPPPTAQQPQPQSQQQQAHQSQPQPQQLEHSGGVYQPMSVETFQSLPDKIILVRHAESLGNVDATTYSNTPDYEVPLSARGWEQAVACGNSLRGMMEAEHGPAYKLFFMTSPYCRTRQTFVGIRQAFPDANFAGVQEEVQLREQDFGNFQNPTKIQADLAERNRFGRFYYRFPDGESGSDVYNRVSIFEDHLIRDMKASRFSASTSLCLVTHGLTMRVFLMRWFNWTVESFLQVYNPPNATPIIVDKISEQEFISQVTKLRDKRQTLQVKHAYRLRNDSKTALKMNTLLSTDPIHLVDHNYLP